MTLGERLLAEINAQLDARGLILRRGTLIEASIVKSAARPPAGDVGEVSERDPDVGFTKKPGSPTSLLVGVERTARPRSATRRISALTRARI